MENWEVLCICMMLHRGKALDDQFVWKERVHQVAPAAGGNLRLSRFGPLIRPQVPRQSLPSPAMPIQLLWRLNKGSALGTYLPFLSPHPLNYLTLPSDIRYRIVVAFFAINLE